MEAGDYYVSTTTEEMNPTSVPNRGGVASIAVGNMPLLGPVKSRSKIKAPKKGLIHDKAESASELTSISGGYFVIGNHSKDHLTHAKYAGNGKVALQFADGLFAGVDLAELDIDTSMIKPESMRASWGSAVEIDTTDGDTFHIDSAVLRAYCDPEYAEELEKSIQELTGN